jgi:hypothetical protein
MVRGPTPSAVTLGARRVFTGMSEAIWRDPIGRAREGAEQVPLSFVISFTMSPTTTPVPLR